MGIACLLKGEQSPNIYSLMLKFFLYTEMWYNRHKREPYSLQTFTVEMIFLKKIQPNLNLF